MMNGRRNFFKVVGLGAAGAISLSAESEKPKTGFYTVDLPYENLRSELITDPEVAIKHLEFNIKSKEIIVQEPMSMQAIYGAAKELWKTNRKYTAYEFPLLAFTPEMFELKDEWTVQRIENVRKAGFTYENSLTSWVCIEVLSQKGLIFDADGQPLKNGEPILVRDGITRGYYQLSKADKLIDLDDHLKEMLGIEKMTGMCYRIA